jgi:NagD protein
MTTKKTYFIDLDGVLVNGQTAVPGAAEFIQRLIEGGHQYLVLTNNSRFTPADLVHRMQVAGIKVDIPHVYNSAMATAAFVQKHQPGGSAYVVGDTGLYQALTDVGYSLSDYNPNYVILGETKSYPYDKIIQATRLIWAGTPFIATNPDPSGPDERGLVPACGAVAALIEKATGFSPYFVGKPNPFMMRAALRYLSEHSENAVMVGDRMDTDIKMGLESGLETVLVLTGVTKPEMIPTFPYRPSRVVNSVAELEL